MLPLKRELNGSFGISVTVRLTLMVGSRCCAGYTGFGCQNLFRSGWQCWCIAGNSLPPRLCTWLPGFRSSVRVAPQRTSPTALFNYIRAGRSTHCAFYHWGPDFPGDCCFCTEQFAGVSPVIAVVASFPQQTKNRNF